MYFRAGYDTHSYKCIAEVGYGLTRPYKLISRGRWAHDPPLWIIF